jgi:hypothetical protein
MRRYLTLVCLLCLALPSGISISGCSRNPGANYCNGLGYGPKITDVASILLQPQTTGISIAFGQTQQAQSPAAKTCKGTAATITGTYTYGTTNNQLLDITPGGNMCAGTWNRNSGGGIANYTICTPPNPLPSTNGLPYGTAYITATANSVVSNPVEVFVHPQVTSVSLVGPQSCLSQGHTAQLDAQAYYSNNGAQTLLCAPNSASVPDCTAVVGTLSYAVGASAVASIATNTTTNLVNITAGLPGTTAIQASIAGSESSAGYFSTCPPQSISVTLANGKTSGTITQGIQQNLITTVLDTNNQPIAGLTLNYQSTDPIDISASGTGGIATNFPGVASIYAICQPGTCNPSPINQIGVNGTGLSISSNPVTITTPGTASDYVWFSAPGQSQYVVPIDLLSGASSSAVRLPYVPNSMVMDRGGNNLYFGSPHALMVYSTTSNSITKQDTNAPGIVLAVAPSNMQLLINDQARQVFYIYSTTAGITASFDGLGNAAAWTPDSMTLYITDNAALNNSEQGITGHTDTLYVYNVNTGWTTYSLPSNTLTNPPLPPGFLPPTQGYTLPASSLPQNVAISSTVQTPAITIPSVGAYLRGTPTEAHTWCPTGLPGNYASMSFYPEADSQSVQSDVLTATTDGQHILGAAVLASGGITLSDIGVDIPTTACTLSAPLSTGGALIASTALPVNVIATAVNQVIASPASNMAFVTYTATAPATPSANAVLPYYIPATGGAAAAVNYVTLTQTGSSYILAPLAGAFTPDNSLFFVSTAGDNLIHYISVPTLTDTQQIAPNLPACTPVSAGGNDAGCTYTGSGTIVPVTAIAVKPRSTT